MKILHSSKCFSYTRHNLYYRNFCVDELKCSEGNVFVGVFVCGGGGGGGVQAHVIETLTVRLKIIAYCYTT